jgi:hypothetical protein
MRGKLSLRRAALLGHSKNRSIYGAIFLPGLAGCDNYNQSIEDFIYRRIGAVLPRDRARVVSPPKEPESDGSFHVGAANTDIVLKPDLYCVSGAKESKFNVYIPPNAYSGAGNYIDSNRVIKNIP